MGILSIPNEVLLHSILGGLSPEDLAALSFQCRRLRLLINKCPVWEEECRSRWGSTSWGGTGIMWTWVDGHGGWAKVFRELAALPSVAHCVKTACEVWMRMPMPYREGGGANTFQTGFVGYRLEDLMKEGFQRAMEALFVVGMEAVTNPAVLDSYAVAVLRRILGYWLSIGPKGGNDFYVDMLDWIPKVYSCSEDEADVIVERDCDWEAGAEDIMNHVAWRRSALEFLPQLMAGDEGVLEAVENNEEKHVLALKNLKVIADHAKLFDEALQELKAPGDNGWPDPPEGVPESHRWWWPGGDTAGDIVAQIVDDKITVDEEDAYHEHAAYDEENLYMMYAAGLF